MSNTGPSRSNEFEKRLGAEMLPAGVPGLTRHRALWEYALAAGAVLIAGAMRQLLDPFFHDSHPFFTFFVSATAVALYTGLGPTLVAIAGGALAAAFFFVPPRLSFSPEGSGKVGMVLYLTGTIFLGLLAYRRRRAEARSNALAGLRSFAESIPQLAWIANPDGFVTWHNLRWFLYTGTTPPQGEGWGWQSVCNPQELPEILDRWRAALRSGASFEMKVSLRAAGGDFHPFLVQIAPAKDEKGRVIRWFGTATDIQRIMTAG